MSRRLPCLPDQVSHFHHFPAISVARFLKMATLISYHSCDYDITRLYLRHCLSTQSEYLDSRGPHESAVCTRRPTFKCVPGSRRVYHQVFTASRTIRLAFEADACILELERQVASHGSKMSYKGQGMVHWGFIREKQRIWHWYYFEIQVDESARKISRTAK